MSDQKTINEAVDAEKPESEPLGLNRLLGVPVVLCFRCNHPMIEVNRNTHYVFYRCQCNRNKGANYDWQTALIDGLEYEIGSAGSLVHQCPTCHEFTFRERESNEVCVMCGGARICLKRHGA